MASGRAESKLAELLARGLIKPVPVSPQKQTYTKTFARLKKKVVPRYLYTRQTDRFSGFCREHIILANNIDDVMNVLFRKEKFYTFVMKLNENNYYKYLTGIDGNVDKLLLIVNSDNGCCYDITVINNTTGIHYSEHPLCKVRRIPSVTLEAFKRICKYFLNEQRRADRDRIFSITEDLNYGNIYAVGELHQA